VLAGSVPNALMPVLDGKKTGFETTIVARTHGPFVAVQALDGAGAVLGTSSAVRG
jgi:hypothetical protein